MLEHKQQLGIVLCIIVIGSLGVGWVASEWYWSTQSFTHVVTVGGSIEAKSNFTPSTALASAPLYEEIVPVNELLTVNGGESRYIWIILSPDSLVNEVYARVWVECPVGGSCTALVSTQSYNVVGGSVAPVEIGIVATDGSESMQIIRDGDPLWVTKSSWGTSYRFIRIQLDFDNSLLGVGEHLYTIRVELGDNLQSSYS